MGTSWPILILDLLLYLTCDILLKYCPGASLVKSRMSSLVISCQIGNWMELRKILSSDPVVVVAAGIVVTVVVEMIR